MTAENIRLTSPSLRLRTRTSAVPIECVRDGWRFGETLGARKYVHNGETFHSYQVTLERQACDDEDLGSIYIQARYLAAALSRVWVFATGLPLTDRGYDLFMTPIVLPPGWESNASAVIPERDWNLLRSPVSSAPLHRTVDQLPLKQAITLLEAYRDTDIETYTMTERYFAALEAVEYEAHLLFFAQALEVAKELLDGTDKVTKQARLPGAVSTRMKRPLDWLFNMSNSRRQTRHLINKQRSVAVQPEMDDDEIADFQHDADLIVRYVASKRLGVPFIYSHAGIAESVA